MARATDEPPGCGWKTSRSPPSCPTRRRYAAICSTTTVCPADLDASGHVGIEDFLALLAAWGTNPDGPPDFDGDDDVDMDDLTRLIADWGECP